MPRRSARWFTQLVLCAVLAAGCSSKNNGHDMPGSTAGTDSSSMPTAGSAGTSASGQGGDGTSVAGAGASGVTGGGAGDAVSGGAGGSGDGPDGGPGEPPVDCLAVMMNQPLGPEATPYPGGTWTVPKATNDTVIEYNINIKMSDGVVLVGDVSYPTDLGTTKRAAGKFPVLLTQNPYGAESFGAQYGELFVKHGYIFASVDVRGTGRSGGGTNDLFSPRAALDGKELVSWAAALEGSDGRMGLQGCSQLGINQLETATLLGPDSPVKAMIPACPSGDFYRDTAFDNGVASVTGTALAPKAVDGDDTAYYRDYWRVRDRVARAPAIAHTNIPLLLWSGWHEPGAVGSLELYTVLQNVNAGRTAGAPIGAGDTTDGKYQVILGDWGHGGGLDLGIQLQWYDTWIKGIDTGMPKDTKTPLHIAELGGTKRWLNARCYPFVKKYTPIYLSKTKALTLSADSDDAQEELPWVPQNTLSVPLEYTSKPFAVGGMLAGPMSAQLQVTSSNTNAQLFVALFDKAPDGTLTKLGFGSIIGSLRRTDADKSWTDENGLPVRPYLTLDQDEAMTSNKETELTVPLGPTVWSIESGHSLVVRISAHPPNEDCLGVLVPPVGCYPTNPMVKSLTGGTYHVHVGGKLGSLISLPLLEHGAMQTINSVATSPTGNADYPLPVQW